MSNKIVEQASISGSCKQPPVYVFRVGHLGDSLVALPALKVLKRAFRDRPLVLISDRISEAGFFLSWEVLRLAEVFSKALMYRPLNKGFLGSLLDLASVARKIRQLGGNLLFYLMPNGSNTRMIARHRFFFERVCGLEVIGIDRALEPYLLRDQAGRLIEQTPEHKRLLEIVVAHCGNQDESMCELLTPNPLAAASIKQYWSSLPDGTMTAAVGAGSKMSCKQWPLERFSQIGQFLVREKGIWPVFFGGANERQLGDQLLANCGGMGLNLCGIPISEAAEALGNCTIYVGNDTGTMHLAAAVGLKCVAIFSARDAPGRWNPAGDGHLILREWVPCEGCMLTVCSRTVTECLDRITVKDVIEAIETVLHKSEPLKEPSCLDKAAM